MWMLPYVLESVGTVTKKWSSEKSALDLRNGVMQHQNIDVGPTTFMK